MSPFVKQVQPAPLNVCDSIAITETFSAPSKDQPAAVEVLAREEAHQLARLRGPVVCFRPAWHCLWRGLAPVCGLAHAVGVRLALVRTPTIKTSSPTAAASNRCLANGTGTPMQPCVAAPPRMLLPWIETPSSVSRSV